MPQSETAEELSEKIYNFLEEEQGEERACTGISDSACRELPGNYVFNVVSGWLSKLAAKLGGPELILPWIFSTLGVPAIYSGLLVPLKDAATLVPQLIASGRIRTFAVRKHFWVLAVLIQSACIAGMGLTVAFGHPGWVGPMIIGLLTVFSTASGVGSVAYKDVLAKTIGRGRRGRLLATRAAGGGALTILAGLYFYFFLNEQTGRQSAAALLYVSAGLWFAAAVLFRQIKETPGATEGGRTPLQELKGAGHLLTEDINFRNFLIARGLLLAIPLVQPFLVLYAAEMFQLSVSGMGVFVILSGAGSLASGRLWGAMADRHSGRLMAVAGFMAAGVCLYVLLLELLPAAWQNIYTFGPGLFLIVLAYGAARLGRKAYLVDYAPTQERPLYISTANTSIGILVLLSGLLGIVAQLFGSAVMIAVLAAIMTVGGVWSLRLRPVYD